MCIRDSQLYKEGNENPKMMSIGLHCRIIGRPGRFHALEKFLKYILTFDNIWIAKRIDIAKFWKKNLAGHPGLKKNNKKYLGCSAINFRR